MNEATRLYYLQAMGIDIFVPKYIDADSVPLPESAQDNDVAEIAIADMPKQRNAAPLPDLESPPHKPEKLIENTTAAVKAKAAKVEAISFSLALWSLPPRIMVVDSRIDKAALPTEALLTNILTSVGVNSDRKLPKAEYMRWPLDRSMELKIQTWAQAHEMVRSFIEARLLTEAVEYLLLMGEQAATLVLSKPTTELSASKFRIDWCQTDAIVLPSLAEILHQPQLKPQVWQTLRSTLN